MSVIGIEFLKVFENMAKDQERIFFDACDYGFKLNTASHKLAHDAVVGLMKIYKYKTTRPQHARAPYDTDFAKCSTFEMFIPFEQDTEGAFVNRFVGVKMTLHFNHHTFINGKKVNESWLGIDFENCKQTENPFQKV